MKWIAHVAILATGLAALVGGACASEPPDPAFPAYLHWSRPTKTESPNHAWELRVFPGVRDGANHSAVVVRKRGGGRAINVLTLERDANVYWGDESRLLILDHPITIPRRILLFRLGSAGSVTRIRATPDLDADIRDRVLRALGRTADVAFYIPTFASWTGSRLVLRVGGTVIYKKTAPPMIAYCYRFTVNSRTAIVEGMTTEPTGEHSKTCQFYP